ncbi:uncharacterized protein LOC112350963 [Selaginella moellendorffii]|uniref:uncharacterized protein LOC112350963 n=1 Tax=Selaginella moellendorffii TaxID=88036 RepID=UPI000D1C97B8|nr:uncharacterized protein LOC112350963 [Selaginella moellendorffii]|eukprot:XP_024543800.1 uncharacterized protein LOC112350963 [Selaginella moellendorffii]
MVVTDEQKKGGEMYQGHEVCLPKAVELLQQFGLPGGLLPLEDVEECGVVHDTGFVWILSKKKVEHYFKLAKRKVCYGTEITAHIVKNKLGQLRGVKARELLLWVDVNEIEVDERDSGKIHFRGLAGITRTFPVECFAPGE